MDEIHIDFDSPPLEAHVNALRLHAQMLSETIVKGRSEASLMIRDFLTGLNPNALAVLKQCLIEEANARRANLQNENNVSFVEEDTLDFQVDENESADEPNFIADNEAAPAVPIRTISITFAVQQPDHHQPFNQNSTTVDTSIFDFLQAPTHEFNTPHPTSTIDYHLLSHCTDIATRINHIIEKPTPADSGGATHSPPNPVMCIHLQL
jgi:hypothetical protein